MGGGPIMQLSEGSTNLLTFGLASVCLVVLIVAIVIYLKYRNLRRDYLEGQRDLKKIYFEIAESLVDTISSGHPFRHVAADFNNSITHLFKVEKLIIYINSRNRYNPLIWHGVDQPGINKLFFATGADCIKRLTRENRPIWFEDFEPHDNLGRLLADNLKMKVMFPIMFGKKLHGLVVISESSTYNIKDIAGYIFSLTDQLAYALELARRPRSAGSAQTKTGKNVEKSGSAETPDSGNNYHPIFHENTRLLKIYNETHLMESFLQLLAKHFQPNFTFLCLPDDKKKTLYIKYKTGGMPDQLSNFSIPAGDSLLNLLSRDHIVHQVQHISEVIGQSSAVRNLVEAGCQLVGSFQLPGRQAGVVGIGEMVSGQKEFGNEEIDIISTLCETVQLTLANIAQFKKIEELSYTDSMTGMYNYRYFYKRLGEEILRAKRFKRYLSLVIFDIDQFKVINDSYGHQTGDQILKQLGDLLHSSVRSIDIVSRYGGEEFCVIMPESDRESCMQFMERLRLKIENFEFKSRNVPERIRVSVSLGGSIFPEDAQRIERLIYCADMALLDAKNSGRNRSSLYRPEIDKASLPKE